MKFTRTQMLDTEIHHRGDTLQAATSTADRTTPAILPEAKTDHDNDLDNDPDNDLDNHHRGQGDEDSPMDNDIVDLSSPITAEDYLDLATQNRLMLEMLLGHQA